MTTKHLDELAEFHLRDLSRIKPGMRLLFGHIPPLDDPYLVDSKQHPYSDIVEVMRVAKISANDLFKFERSVDWATEEKPVIFYSTENHGQYHRYASDAGIIPYTPGGYNTANFTVILSDLEDAGIMLELDVTEDYQARLDVFNTQVIEAPEYMYDY